MIDTNTVSDIARVVHDVAPNISYQEILEALVTTVALARVLRKAIPDHLQLGNFGLALKHASGEINPVKGQATNTQTAKIETPAVPLVPLTPSGPFTPLK